MPFLGILPPLLIYFIVSLLLHGSHIHIHFSFDATITYIAPTGYEELFLNPTLIYLTFTIVKKLMYWDIKSIDKGHKAGKWKTWDLTVQLQISATNLGTVMYSLSHANVKHHRYLYFYLLHRYILYTYGIYVCTHTETDR